MNNNNLKEKIDLEGNHEGYSGTFRWKSSLKLPSLPSINSNNIKVKNSINYDEGWLQYLLTRDDYTTKKGIKVNEPLVTQAQNNLSLIDCLSTPISIIYVLKKLGIIVQNNNNRKGPITLICIGCSAKAEERILKTTNCFQELLLYFENTEKLELILVGPEISETKENIQYIEGNNQSTTWIASLYKGTAIEFFRSNPKYMGSLSTIIIGINCGYGNFDNPMPKRYDLLVEWLPDLYFLTAMKIPIIFTCANDYSDLFGELTVMIHILGAKLIMMPELNPFSFASTFIPENSQEDNDYSRGNSYIYAIQHHDPKRRFHVQKGEYRNVINQLLKMFQQQTKNEIDATLYLSKITFSWPDNEQTTTTTTTKLQKDTIEKNEINLNIECHDSNSKSNSNDNNVTEKIQNNDDDTTTTTINDNDNNNKSNNIVIEKIQNNDDHDKNNVIQKIQNNNLVIIISTSNSNLNISCSNDGLTLAIEDKTFIELEKKISSSSIIAKYSKKKKTLTITGIIIE